MVTTVTEVFEKTFGEKPEGVYFAPGRADIMGNHCEFNGGNILCMAVNLGIYGAIKKREDDTIRLYSDNFSADGVLIHGDGVGGSKISAGWDKYIIAAVRAFNDNGFEVRKGFDACFASDLPMGEGLASSTSLTVLACVMINDAFSLGLSPDKLAALASYAENRLCGRETHIKDQFAIIFGKKDSAILLDTSEYDYDYIEIKSEGTSFGVAFTGERECSDRNAYVTRRREMQTALEIMQYAYNVSGTDIFGYTKDGVGNEPAYACKATSQLVEDFVDYFMPRAYPRDNHGFDPQALYKRIRHVVSENERAKIAGAAIQHNDHKGLGEWMTESGKSFRYDFEATPLKADHMLDNLWNTDGVLGAKLMGCGFGGSILMLFENAKKDKAGTKFITITPGDGAGRIG